MSKQDPAEQVRFLVSCIGHTTNGRPDFTLVAEELGIVSKAAASQKRYERMLKANGVNASKPAAKSGTEDDKTPVSTPVKRKPTRGAGGSAKKKVKATKKEESDDDVKDSKLVPKARDAKPAKKELKKEAKEDHDSSLSDAPDSDMSDAGTSFDSI
ncbi:hypothetical protein Trco_000253 [Trichoderma cornu-damae]|uniref:Myb-like DNA-binding domain-containing protein n=1 Tax=Trichoderma cornu-damae TaxID=654480 RepID=A0A9P8QVU5_9HYPO|nr:hypothetical protein Trco_000253 [Trichoderma cornu-damae]